MLSSKQRAQHRRWLKALTGIPTAAACEHRVVEWVTRWVAARPNLRLRRDGVGNMVITCSRTSKAAPLLITAHLDHPAFVVRRPSDDREVELEFRGGVHDPYFQDARLEIFDADGGAHRAAVVRLDSSVRPFKRVTCLLRAPATLQRGDVGRWALRGRGGKPTVAGGLLYAPACDDLAGVAAALSALDVLRNSRSAGHVGVLLTVAEEVGFLGAISACRRRTVPKRARLICLECSRSFPESPIGAGPILRVGDKMSVFSPDLTNRLGVLMSAYQDAHPGFKTQRKLMPGGVCEASTFAAYGYESTCVCLPLGNYHNMVDIDGVLAGKRPARIGAEYISVADFDGMVELLVHFAQHIDSARYPSLRERMEQRYRKHGRLIEKD